MRAAAVTWTTINGSNRPICKDECRKGSARRMQKLIIQDIAKMNDDWYAVCFHGPERSQHAMNAFLARQPKEYAYWDENGLHGKGAWIVRLDFFQRLTARFENGERAMVIAQRVAALKQINLLATRRRTKRR